MGAILVVGLSTLGAVAAEFTIPGDAFPNLKVHAFRGPAAAGLVASWLAAVGILATYYAPMRANITLGAATDRLQAACIQTRSDDTASPAEATMACGAAETALARLATATGIDQLVTVLAALTEAAGAWGMLRLAELAVPFHVAISLQRARRRRLGVEAAVRGADSEFRALVAEALEAEGITVADLQSVEGGGPTSPAESPEPPTDQLSVDAAPDAGEYVPDEPAPPPEVTLDHGPDQAQSRNGSSDAGPQDGPAPGGLSGGHLDGAEGPGSPHDVF